MRDLKKSINLEVIKVLSTKQAVKDYISECEKSEINTCRLKNLRKKNLIKTRPIYVAICSNFPVDKKEPYVVASFSLEEVQDYLKFLKERNEKIFKREIARQMFC